MVCAGGFDLNQKRFVATNCDSGEESSNLNVQIHSINGRETLVVVRNLTLHHSTEGYTANLDMPASWVRSLSALPPTACAAQLTAPGARTVPHDRGARLGLLR